MNKTLLKISLGVVLLLAVSTAFGQTILTQTTLSAAVSDDKVTRLVVASATGITAPSATNSAATTELYIDNELMDVTAVSGTTISVRRGTGTGLASSHAKSSLVFIGPPSAFSVVPPTGSCTRGNLLYLPVMALKADPQNAISDCLGGVWVNGTNLPLQNTPFQFVSPNTGGTAYTSINTNGTTLAATTMYCTEVDLPFNKNLTGIGILNGTTVGTDNHLVALYDASGNLLANSATAGVLAASASTYQQIAFTKPYFAVGPAQYFACMQTNGTTATVRMIVTGTQDTFLTKGVTGQTFGTVPATITVPTTFTTAVGPYVYFY